METIDIKEMLDYFKSKISVIILMVALVGIIGGLYCFLIQKPEYKSSTTILLTTDNSTGVITYNDLNVNKNLVSTYSQIVKSKRVLNQVIEDLELDLTYNELTKKVDVSAVSDTELIRITVTDRDKVLAKKIANKTAKVFSDEIPEIYNVSNVSILDTAEIAKAPSNINIPKQSMIFILVGLVLGCGLVFMVYYFDRSIKSSEQIETKVGLPILGTIQEMKRGGK